MALRDLPASKDVRHHRLIFLSRYGQILMAVDMLSVISGGPASEQWTDNS